MATAATSTMNRDEFLAIGTHCSESSCHQLDFLPFRCPSCSKAYCSDHWRPPNGHDCPRYDARAHDNIIPSCPICSQPVPHPLSISPDEAVSTHLESGQCQALHAQNPSNGRPKTPPKTKNMCDEPKCRIKMVVPITCETCRKRFCAKHRWGKDHACPGSMGNNTLGNGNGNPSKGMGGASGGLNVLKRAQEALASATAASLTSKGASTSNPITQPNPVPSALTPTPTQDEPKTKHKIMNNLSMSTKIDKRAMAEQQSALKGLETRAKKGLLTEDEKVKYATMRAMHAKQSGGGKDGCLVS